MKFSKVLCAVATLAFSSLAFGLDCALVSIYQITEQRTRIATASSLQEIRFRKSGEAYVKAFIVPSIDRFSLEPAYDAIKEDYRSIMSEAITHLPTNGGQIELLGPARIRLARRIGSGVDRYTLSPAQFRGGPEITTKTGRNQLRDKIVSSNMYVINVRGEPREIKIENTIEFFCGYSNY